MPAGQVREAPRLIDLWAVARYDLRLTNEEFYDLTPRQFSKLYDRHLDSRRHIELLHGYTTSAVINSSFSPPREPIPPSRFMPSLFDQQHDRAPKRRSRKAIAADIAGTMRGLVAATNRKPVG